MSARKIKGISLFVVGGLSLLGGILSFAFLADPGWWPYLLEGVGVMMKIFGFKFVYPDVD